MTNNAPVLPPQQYWVSQKIGWDNYMFYPPMSLNEKKATWGESYALFGLIPDINESARN